jgi:hypothetical protein
VPAGDIAENPYWKRDVRRSYPKLSVVRQPDVVALLSVGSAAKPKEDKLQIGEAGKKQLVALKEEGEKGLSAFFEKEKSMAQGVLGPNEVCSGQRRGASVRTQVCENLCAISLGHTSNTDVSTATLAGPLCRGERRSTMIGVLGCT